MLNALGSFARRRCLWPFAIRRYSRQNHCMIFCITANRRGQEETAHTFNEIYNDRRLYVSRDDNDRLTDIQIAL
jgi:hypothetical protein